MTNINFSNNNIWPATVISLEKFEFATALTKKLGLKKYQVVHFLGGSTKTSKIHWKLREYRIKLKFFLVHTSAYGYQSTYKIKFISKVSCLIFHFSFNLSSDSVLSPMICKRNWIGSDEWMMIHNSTLTLISLTHTLMFGL